MRIGINCLNVDPDYVGGVNTYTMGLLNGFAQLNGSHAYVVFVSSKNVHLFKVFESKRNFKLVIIDDYESRWRRRLIWQLVKVSNREAYRILSNLLFKKMVMKIEQHCDVIYFPNTVIFPFNYKVPVVLSMHDIQQVHYPEFFSPMELKSRSINYRLSAEYSSFMQASSVFVGNDFLDYFEELKRDKIFVISEGVNIEVFRNAASNPGVLTKYHLPEKFLFYPAQLWPHKNHLTLLKALAKLKKEKGLEIPLVLTGAKYGAYDTIMNCIREEGLDQVHYLGKIPFDDLLSLYKLAYYLVIAVLYESSSLPILEAAACGTPIIASDTPPNKEISQVLKITLFEKYDVNGLAELIAEKWCYTGDRNEQIEYNNLHINQFSWLTVAEKYLHFIEKHC